MMEKTRKSALVIFQKNAVPGKVKTRLAATVGEKKALEIYLSLVEHTYSQIRNLRNTDIFIYYSDYLEENPNQGLPHFHQEVQSGNDLGERMHNAFQDLFQKGYNQIVLIGTDCPEITTEDIETAFQILEQEDVCIGPALDGGYYLIGMRRFYNFLFEKIAWSTSEVLNQTLEKLKLHKANFELLRILRDIDTEEDLDAIFPKKTIF
jgi:uncharacterized protein